MPLAAASALAAALAAFFSFLARFLALTSSGVYMKKWVSSSVLHIQRIDRSERGMETYLLPCPNGSETVKEPHVLEQVWIQP